MKLALLAATALAMNLNVCNPKVKTAEEQTSEAQEIVKTAQRKSVETDKKIKKKKPKKVTGLKLHPLKQYCVDYTHTGQMMQGTSQMCSRKHGLETFTISNMKVGVGGFSRTQNQHTITIKDKIYNIDPEKMTGTIAKNPMYDVMKKNKGRDFGEAMFAAMGYTSTGQNKTIAGTKCTVYNSAQMGTACLTKHGVLLEQSVMGMGQIATRVSLNDGGANANYTLYKKMKISEAPDIEDIMKKMSGR